MRRFRGVFALLLSLGAAGVHAADCPNVKDYPAGGIPLVGTADGPATFSVRNPAKGAASATLCLVTDEDNTNGRNCAAVAADPITAPSPVDIGLCTTGTNNFNPVKTSAEIIAADAIVLNLTTSGEVRRHLRIEGKDSAGKDMLRIYDVNAGAPDLADDSRYKLWLYTGYTYLRTQSDFKNGYAEVLARFETRLSDERIWMKKNNFDLYNRMANVQCGNNACNRSPYFKVFRLYGETGLTGATVIVDNGATSSSRIKQAFAGSFGLGYGWTIPVTVEKNHDTNAFTVLGIGRLGVVTIPGVDADPNATPPITSATPGKTAYNSFLGVRIENETGGGFEGAYLELGGGESEQFTRKKLPRLRFDGLVPFTRSAGAFRLAARLQLDTATPFNRKQNVDPAGEIRISLLLNMDVHELVKRLSP